MEYIDQGPGPIGSPEPASPARDLLQMPRRRHPHHVAEHIEKGAGAGIPQRPRQVPHRLALMRGSLAFAARD